MNDRIDYILVIFRNYDLLDIQRELFSKLNISDYRFIIVDNTPDSEKKPIQPTENELVVLRNSINEFDGVSHGAAIDYGLTFADSNIVCIMDSDFFIFNKNIHNYIRDRINSGYEAIGATFGSPHYRNTFPELFDNIPVCFCYYCKREFAKQYTWVVDRHELNFAGSFIETGWRFRDHVIRNKTKTIGWSIDNIHENSKQIYRNESGEIVGMHYFAGSHVSMNSDFRNEIKKYVQET